MTEAERDEELVRRFRAGEPQAFTDLVRRHQHRVYSVCLRVLGDTDAAADVAQETFITVLRKLDGFRGDAAFTTWLHRVAVNACYDELRRKRRRPMLHVLPDDGSDHEPGPPAPDHAEEVAGTHTVESALASIPEEFRMVLVLADVHDMAYEQISKVLDVPVGTVKSRVHRGRLALAAALGIDPEREPGRRPQTSEREP